ncbi:MAG: exodeoxyribonuclease VII small subunit [Cyanobium sp.]|jgi:exodeoxyribonuclease VII small subunit
MPSPRSRSGAGSAAAASTPAAVDAAAVEPAAADALAVDAAPATTSPSEAAAASPAQPDLREGIDDLSFREAQVALELVLSQLQASDLDVEVMVALHRRGQAYAERCETLLRQVEQEVQLWDPDAPDASPRPYPPGPSGANG